VNYLDNYLEEGKFTDPFLHRVGEVIQPLPDNAPMVVKGRAHGGFGAVYFVQANDTSWISALKVPRFDLFQNSDTLESFTREAMVWINLPSNALILPAYRVVRYSGVPYVHMEFVPAVTKSGASIGAVVRDSRRPLSGGALSIVAGQLLYLLAELEKWDPSFAHGDLKPDNVLLHLPDGINLDSAKSDELEIRLSDFGLSRYRNDPITHATTAGDLRYLAPEVLIRHGWMGGSTSTVRETIISVKDDRKAQDIYAVGCTIFEMIYGRHWHVVSSALRTVSTLGDRGVTPEAIASVRPDVRRPMLEIVFRCLDRSAQNRPKTFMELQDLWKTATLASGGVTNNYTIRGTKVDSRTYPEAEGVPVYRYLASIGREADFCLRITELLFDASNLRAAGRFKDADALLQSVEREIPGFPPALAARAHGLALQGAGNPSMGLYRRALEGYLEDENLRSIDKLGYGAVCTTMALLLAQMARRDLADQARILAQWGVESLPDEARSINALGLALLLGHEVEQALTWLRQALKMDTGNRQLRTGLAVGLFAARAQDSSEFKNLALTNTEKAQALDLTKRLGYTPEVSESIN
jgi:serine/threonine protein kinase